MDPGKVGIWLGIVLLSMIILGIVISLLILNSVPFPVFATYLKTAFWSQYNPESYYILKKCTDANQTLFLIVSGSYPHEVEEQTFDAKGNEICTNFYSIGTCKMSCPYEKCVNRSFTCEIISDEH